MNFSLRMLTGARIKASHDAYYLARDIIMSICQDTTRNQAKSPNAAKKKLGEKLKPGRKAVLKPIELTRVAQGT